VIQNSRPSQWEALLPEAFKIIDYVNRDDEFLKSWTFGGGTAMMLQIGHRESHDIDLFLDDPQLLPYIRATLEDLNFEIGMPSYDGDGVRHLKVAFDKVGEIDFIVAGQITENNAKSTNVLSRKVELETIAEIIGKKICYRGSSLQPRDVFDIAAACYKGFADEIEKALSIIPDHRKVAAEKLDSLSHDYINNTISQLMIKPDFIEMSKDSISIAREVLNSN